MPHDVACLKWAMEEHDKMWRCNPRFVSADPTADP